VELSELQERILKFEKDRGWESFRASLVYIHLIEEITEIGRHILADEGYKVSNLGHAPVVDDVASEFAQAMTLFIQLANRFNVNLEEAINKEMEKMEKRFPSKEWREYIRDRKT